MFLKSPRVFLFSVVFGFKQLDHVHEAWERAVQR